MLNKVILIGRLGADPEADDQAPDDHHFTGKEYQCEPEKITLGVRKAKAIIDNVDWLYKFIKDNE